MDVIYIATQDFILNDKFKVKEGMEFYRRVDATYVSEEANVVIGPGVLAEYAAKSLLRKKN